MPEEEKNPDDIPDDIADIEKKPVEREFLSHSIYHWIPTNTVC